MINGALNREFSSVGASTSTAPLVCLRSYSARPWRFPRLVQQTYRLDIRQSASTTALPAAMQSPLLRGGSMDWRKECYGDQDDEAFLELTSEEVRHS